MLFKTIQRISAGPNPHASTVTCLARERSVYMTTSSSSRPVKLQRRAVKERRQLTLYPIYTCRGRMYPFLATELTRQQREKVQRFNLLTIKGWNSAQRRQYLSKEEWFRAYATDVAHYVACKQSNTLCIIMLPFPESTCQCQRYSQTRYHCHCHCVSHSSDSITQSECC